MAMPEERSPSLVSRLHDYLRGQASGRADVTLVPPFTLVWPHSDAGVSAPYAVPDAPLSGDVHAALARLGAAFAGRGHRPRITFLAAFAPDLLPALQAAGFAEETRTELLACTPTALRPAAVVPGLTIVTLDIASPLADQDQKEGLDANEQGFDPQAAPTTAAAADAFRQGLVSSRAFTARLHGVPVGAGMFTPPVSGVTELVGTTTLAPYRRRGVAAFLTTYAAQTAFALGVELAFLSTTTLTLGASMNAWGSNPAPSN